VEVWFDSAIALDSFTGEDVTLTTPNGLLPHDQITVTCLAGRIFEVSFPTQNAPGPYTVQIGPHITNFFGTEMDQNTNGVLGEGACDAYTMAFCIGPAQRVVFGRVTAGGCAGVEGVTLAAEPGPVSATTDTNGNYVMSLPAGWNGTITPSLAGYAFVPASGSVTWEGYRQADFALALLPLSARCTNSTLLLEWPSVSGLTYWLQSSESLTNWADCTEPFPGTGGLMSVTTNLNAASRQFFRLRAED
jgi:hypothetical protein